MGHIFQNLKNPCHSSTLPPPPPPPPAPHLANSKFHATKISCLNFWQLPVSNRLAISKISERRGQPREVYPALQKFLPGSFVSIHSISVAESFAFWKFNNSVFLPSGNFRGKFSYNLPLLLYWKAKGSGEYWKCRGEHTRKPIWTFGASMRLKWRAMGNTRERGAIKARDSL